MSAAGVGSAWMAIGLAAVLLSKRTADYWMHATELDAKTGQMVALIQVCVGASLIYDGLRRFLAYYSTAADLLGTLLFILMTVVVLPSVVRWHYPDAGARGFRMAILLYAAAIVGTCLLFAAMGHFRPF